MKKYLMTGIAAFALCAAFTSCSKDLDSMSPEELENLETQKAFSKYESAFIATFGQPAVDQEWGFGATVTRSEKANANEWADPNKEYGGLKVPPPLTDEQIAVVKKYFQTVQYPEYEDPGWTNYFMQQVYKGYTDPMPGYSPEKYLAADGNTWIFASNNMDHLAAIDPDADGGEFVDHINNFNHGDCSPNYDVLDNGQTVGGTHHTDKIMYMKESTTASFGYYNSNGSVRHTEYTGLVSYETIMKALGSAANCLDDGWNRSFMGFDFEQMVGPEIQAAELDYSVQYNTDLYGPDGYPVKEYKWYEWNGQQYPLLNSNQNRYCGTFYKKANGQDLNDSDITDDLITSLLAQGYLPVDGGANKKWVKVGGCADGYYSDWIVCLTKADQDGPFSGTRFLRVMAEDLSASQASDFDFNDVVFDVERISDTKARITLQAAGGTLPLRINSTNGEGGWEVHAAFNVPVNTMVNTRADLKGLTNADCEPVVLSTNFAGDFTEANFAETVRNIRVEVYKSKTWMPLDAKTGIACCKFAVSEKKAWPNERQNIDSMYGFSEWVKGFTTTLVNR